MATYEESWARGQRMAQLFATELEMAYAPVIEKQAEMKSVNYWAKLLRRKPPVSLRKPRIRIYRHPSRIA